MMIFLRTSVIAASISLSMTLKVGNSQPLTIKANETNFESILNESIVLINNDEGITEIEVSSNIPLTMLQYREIELDDRLIPDNALQVYLKKKCNDTGSFETYNPEATISMINDQLTINFNGSSDGFLPPSSFDAEWSAPQDCIGETFWEKICDFLNPFTKRMKRVQESKNEHRHFFPWVKTSDECTVVAEILYDACDVTLNVQAPSVQVFNQHEIKDLVSTSNNCVITSYGILHFPGEANATFEESDSYVIPAEGKCESIVDGRPFVDKTGKTVMAEAFIMDSFIPQWSNFNELSEQYEVINNDNPTQVDDWTDRAIGEHSSIASFAAFTIALMTNGAPPDLIHDSLQAAMDEFNHAQTSFEMASYLSQQSISPGPLPATSHKFDQDLHQLAFGTAKEGCVDETLSALLGAAEITVMDEKKIDKPGNWKDKVEKIVKEEANHSALAWRTLEWICRKDQGICESIINYLRTDGRSRALKRIQMEGLSLDNNIVKIIKYEWDRVTNSLLSQLEMNQSKSKTDLLFDQKKTNFIGEIADNILNNFIKATKAPIGVPDIVEY